MSSREFRKRLLRVAKRAGVQIPSAILAPLDDYFRLLSRWNVKMNLTSLPLETPSDETFERLIVEPLAAALYIQDAPITWYDIGSGGGSPAIPVKLARPALKLWMVESRTKKAAFLRETVRTLRLKDATVVNARFQDLLTSNPQALHSADLITARAIRTSADFFLVARQLVARRGHLLVLRSVDSSSSSSPAFARPDAIVLGDSLGTRLDRYEPVFHVEQTS